MTYNHAISLNFSVDSENELPSADEILAAIKRKLEELNELNVFEEIEIFDTRMR